MKRWAIAAAVLLTVLTVGHRNLEAAVQPANLRCEYVTDPLAIDTPQPRLSWILQSTERGQKQTAYQIIAASTPASLDANRGDLWDSGRVQSDQTAQVEYAGKRLTSRLQCHWKVRVWDKDEQPSAWSKPACWTVGLLQSSDWQSQWIGATADRPAPAPDDRIGRNITDAKTPPFASILLRKEVALAKKPVRATAYYCGLGYCQLSINGWKVGDAELDPGFTDYTKRVFYITRDVTDLLQSNHNVIAATLGGGWYDSPGADVWSFHRAPWIAPPKLLLRIDIDFADGTHGAVVSDTTWKCTTGPIVFNSIRGGETHDARREKPGWDGRGYDDSTWPNARIVSAPKGRLVPQCHPPIRVTESIRPVKLTEPKPGVYVFDLGVNIAGWAQLKTRGSRGQTIKLGFHERLIPDGTVDTQTFLECSGNRFQTDEFILKGDGEEIYEPRFTYHGFRYVQVNGLSQKPTLDSLTGRWVHTAPEPAGHFSCSNPLVNRIQEMIARTQLNNLHGIPTDCPQREKIGWTEDGCVTMEEAICNFDMAAFYTKWFHDMLDAQDANGHAACIAPSPGWGRSLADGSPGPCSDPWWGGAIVRTPWQLYRYYGDTRAMTEGYDAMVKYMDYVARHSQDHIPWNCEGDWLEVGSAGPAIRTQGPLTSSAAYFFYAKTLSCFASLLHRPDDAKKYARLAETIQDVFNRRFLDPKTGRYAQDSQTSHALPLSFGIVPLDKRPLVVNQLVRNIQVDRKNHISSGIVGTFYVFQSLLDADRNDVAYTMLTQEDFPSWGHMLRNGSTTIWEEWNGNGSLNHPALGAIGAWLYQAIGGIRLDPNGRGFRTIVIKPAIVGDLTWANTHYDSIAGRIACNWKREDGNLFLHITIPANTTATVYVPTTDSKSVREGGKAASEIPGTRFLRTEGKYVVYATESGTYQFQSTWSPSLHIPRKRP